MTTTTRRAVLAGAAAAIPAAVAVPAVALPTEPDPIFAAIEAHKRADLANQSFDGTDDDRWPLDIAEGEALADLLETTPTTLRGCAAMLRYLDAYFERSGSADFWTWLLKDDREGWGATLYLRLADVIDRQVQS